MKVYKESLIKKDSELQMLKDEIIKTRNNDKFINFFIITSCLKLNKDRRYDYPDHKKLYLQL